LAGILLGNTDMHFKNFAMFHSDAGYRLTPSYDQVCAALYDYKTLALSIHGAANLRIGNVKPKHLIELGSEFGLSLEAIRMVVEQLERNLEAAKHAFGDSQMGNQLIKQMEKRWNGTFALIGQALSKKR
jgi:serine/threonine-protein kinase HipA